jgi:hypothetical protein
MGIRLLEPASVSITATLARLPLVNLALMIKHTVTPAPDGACKIFFILALLLIFF